MRALITVLAIARLTTLVTQDELTSPLREAIQRWAQGAEDYSFRERIFTLSDCNRCMSIWAAAAVLLAGQNKVSRPALYVLAGSQAALVALAVHERLER